jgi:GNAT superfamily N-acetyltransferase
VAYLLLDVVAGAGHIEQVSVDPRYGRRGIGRRLIGTAAEWARDQGLDELTLTTFAVVPWNAPYYERLGFTVIADREQSPELRGIRNLERARGLDGWPRVAMRRPIDG